MTTPTDTRVHGGSDAAGPVRFDFSTNSNACGPCPSALRALALADATQYPDPQYQALTTSLAAFHGVEPARIVLAASASEFILRMTAHAVRQGARTVWLPTPSYGDYGHAASVWGLQRTTDPKAADLLWACAPSSPLGQALETPLMAHLQGAPAASTSLRVLDCAYAPLRLGAPEPAPDVHASALASTWTLWSPNKALGLTGVRGAYAIAPAGAGAQTDAQALAHAAALRALAPSWPLGAHGVALLQSWTEAATQQWLTDCLVTLAQWKARQVALLQERGWHCLPSETPHFCAQPPACRAATTTVQTSAMAALTSALRAQHIKLRDTTSMGLPGHFRLRVHTPQAQDALRAALCAKEHA